MLFFKPKHNCGKHGHNYEARYNKQTSCSGSPMQIMNCSFSQDAHFASAVPEMISISYIADVCSYCGDKIDLLDRRISSVIQGQPHDGC